MCNSCGHFVDADMHHTLLGAMSTPITPMTVIIRSNHGAYRIDRPNTPLVGWTK